MKKLLILAMILLKTCSVATAQTNVVTVWYTNSDTVNVGDSAWCEIFTSHAFPLNPYTDSVTINISGGNQFVSNLCYSQYDTMPKVSTAHGNLTRIKFIIPLNASLGQQNYLIGCQDCYPGGHSYPVFIKENLTGIKKYKEEIKYDYYYYDLGLYKIKINLQTKEKTIVE